MLRSLVIVVIDGATFSCYCVYTQLVFDDN